MSVFDVFLDRFPHRRADILRNTVNIEEFQLRDLFRLHFHFARIFAADIHNVNGAYLVPVGVGVVLFLAGKYAEQFKAFGSKSRFLQKLSCTAALCPCAVVGTLLQKYLSTGIFNYNACSSMDYGTVPNIFSYLGYISHSHCSFQKYLEISSDDFLLGQLGSSAG